MRKTQKKQIDILIKRYDLNQQLNMIKRTAVSITEIAVFFIPRFKMKGEKENGLEIVIQPNQRVASSYGRSCC